MLKLIYILIFIVIYVIKIVNNELIIKPVETIITRDQYKPFIALCTGERDSRVVNWQSPSQIDIVENPYGRITTEHKNSGLRLRIRNLTVNDQGNWKCLGFDQYGKSISTTFYLNVKIPIKFVSESIQYAELDSSALIKCRVISNPSVEISWFKGHDKIPILSPNYEQKNDGLKINRVSLIDNDTFWCQADLIENGESKDYQIQLLIAQRITSTKIQCLIPCAVEKRTTTLICQSNGIPRAEYSWSYEQNAPFIVNGVSKYVVRGNRLIINNVDETDNGRYICHAFNNYDKTGQKTEYIIKVIIPPVVSYIPQMEINIDDSYFSQRVSFSCRLERGSLDNLSFQWVYSNNTPIQTINGVSIHPSHRLSELIFDPVHRQHHGNYTCLVQNSADTTSTMARLLAQYKPVFLGPKIDYLYSVPNHQIIIKCEFDSYPPPVIQWMKISVDNNEMILEDNNPQVIKILTEKIDSTIYQTELRYNPSEKDFDFKFQCRANNSRIEKHFLILRRAQLPGIVRISGMNPTSNTIKLNVTLPLESGGLPLIEYIIRYEQMNIHDSLKIISFPIISNGSNLIEIKSLQAATLYRIQIAIKSEAGQSDFSPPAQAETLAGNVPQFHLSNHSCINITSCLISWSIENNGGSSISQAEIFYAEINRKGKAEGLSKPIHLDSQSTEYQLKELKPNKNYLIIVRLYNIAGYDQRNLTINTIQLEKSRSAVSVWKIVGTIILIIIVLILGFLLLILCRIPYRHYNPPRSE